MMTSLRLASLVLTLSALPAAAEAQTVSLWTLPSRLDFGTVPVGEERIMDAEVKVFGGFASLRAVLEPGHGFTLLSPTADVTPLPDGGALPLRVRFSPQSMGVVYDHVNIFCLNTSCSGTLSLEANGTAGAGAPSADIASRSGTALRLPYPNPATLLLTIPLEVRSPRRVLITITDAEGDLVETVEEGMMETGTAAIIQDVSKLPSGSYRYQVYTPEGVVSHPFQIVH